ncbi:environmental stress-induced protein Ves [Sedimentibacter acidaminivorans]|jgi:uncharacterized protein|uniref:Environmental stress-induced protein Ves n=2 Tax=Sedimentibacter acidaminivorans TaxID=913099 RepID=A0ABS4GF11_9FIRM|nr:environmental stress-induced protein Ves [Sedimentibacter acidaminivorans]
MMLDYRIIKNTQHKTSNWSGGTTTELCIYPEDSSYQDRDFTWRISSATVDLETSKFTVLSDYERIIMILKGKLFISHDGINSKTLNKLEQYEFDGGINTDSIGKVIDYNLMMRKGLCSGKVEVVQLEPKSTLTTVFEDEEIEKFDQCIEVYYNISEKLKLSINESSTIILENKDILVVNKKNNSTLFECYNGCEQDAVIIKSSILFNNK